METQAADVDMTAFRRDERVAVRGDVRISFGLGQFVEAILVDISRYGLSIDSLQRFGAQTPLRVTFANGETARARAVWSDEFQDGIVFEQPLDAGRFETLLSTLRG